MQRDVWVMAWVCVSGRTESFCSLAPATEVGTLVVGGHWSVLCPWRAHSSKYPAKTTLLNQYQKSPETYVVQGFL